MLTELSFSNFKSWSQVDEMRLAPITGLFGTNSSGKSSILQLLLLLKQTAESSDRKQVLNFGGEIDSVRLGAFRDVVHQHDTNREVHIGIKWRLDKPLNVYDPLTTGKKSQFSGRDMALRTVIRQNSNERLLAPSIAYSLGENTFTFEQDPGNPGSYVLNVSTSASNDFRFTRTRGRAWSLSEPPTKCYGFPDQVRAYYQNADFLSDLELQFEQMLGRVYYLAPLREFPERDYRWSGGEPTGVGRRGEQSVAALLAGRERGRSISPGYKRRKQTIEERVAYWLHELGLIDSFAVRRIADDSNLYEVRVARTKEGPDALIPDVGFGVSQVLPVLVLCYYAPEGSTILLEQPEIHLHPSVQAGLADVFLDVVKNRRMQIIVESHSEHLLTRLQRRVAEGPTSESGTSHETVALYFCNASGSGSSLVPLEVDLLGQIKNWPADFFGDRLGEIAAVQRAGIRRRQREEQD